MDGFTAHAGEIMQMRKRTLAPDSADTAEATAPAAGWLDVEQLAEVEFTSEDAAHPIEAAFRPGEESGWRAAEAGTQVIRLHFDDPQHLRRIRLVFHEREAARTQEFVLRWSADRGRSYREVVRQQYNFSPPSTAREIEDYTVDLNGVTSLELSIVPNVDGGGHRASLTEWRLG